MIPPHFDRFDKRWLAFVHLEMDQGIECLFCKNPATDWCHIQHGSNRTSDFLGYPACSGCHHQLDHQPRGRLYTLKAARVKACLAEWFAFGLPLLINAYTVGGYQSMLEDA